MGDKKRLLCTLGFLGIFILVCSASMPQKQDEPKTFKSKNLKVLPKNISYEELDSVMDSFKDALGVKCGHCHVPQKDNPRKMDFASDAKPEKEMARKMMRMTSRINRKYFSPSDGEAMIQVQCQTCHRGNAKPEIKRKASK
jgi:hypothetical protein